MLAIQRAFTYGDVRLETTTRGVISKVIDPCDVGMSSCFAFMKKCLSVSGLGDVSFESIHNSLVQLKELFRFGDAEASCCSGGY